MEPPPSMRVGGSSLASLVMSGSGASGSSISKAKSSWDKPYFDDASPRNVTTVVGQTAELSCHVKHPADRTVSTSLVLWLSSSS
ncbi:hypothetical protein TKK_0005498 [Trichogramma kaykai]